MTEPAAKRPRTPAAIALAIMLLACALIVTALALLAQGAVAYELRDVDVPSAARPVISDQTKERGSQPDRARRAADAAPAESPRTVAAPVAGSFTLGAAPSPAERALEARVAASSAGGGFVAGGLIHVVVEDQATAGTQR